MTAYAAEAKVWTRLAGLLPSPEDVEMIQGCWDIGEQEAGLWQLVEKLLEQGVGVDGFRRAEIAAMAVQWDVWDQYGEDIVALPDDPGRPGPLRVYVGMEPVEEGERLLVPWMRCLPCDRILTRSHERASWGMLHCPSGFVVTARGEAPLVFDNEEPGAVWAALAAVSATCRAPGDG